MKPYARDCRRWRNMELGWVAAGRRGGGGGARVTAICFSAMILASCSFWHRAAFIMRPRVPRSPPTPVQVARFASELDLRYSLRLLYFLLINIIEYELLMWCNLIICEYEFT